MVLTYWGTAHLDTLLDHYGTSKTNRAGKQFSAVINPDVARGEFLPFKRALYRCGGENQLTEAGEETRRFLTAPEVFHKLFCGKKSYKTVFKSKIFSVLY